MLLFALLLQSTLLTTEAVPSPPSPTLTESLLQSTLGVSAEDTLDVSDTRAPLFGYVLDGKSPFLSDFAIDCDGRAYQHVNPRGGRRDASRDHGRRHQGLDIPVRDQGFLCYGPGREAVVLYIGFGGEEAVVSTEPCLPGAGTCVKLERKEGGRHVESVFAHLARSLVAPGQVVRRGDPIGVVGRSGQATAPHLHYEKRVDGRSVRLEPIEYRSF